MKTFLALLFALGLLAGCATEKQELRLNVAPSAVTHRIFFPPPTDGQVPRYVYIGELLGEQNFAPPEGKKENVLITALRWVVGLFDAPDKVVLQRPQLGIIDDNGRIYVTDVSRGAVYVFDEKEGRLDVWEQAGKLAHFSAPAGIAAGPEGKVFVSDADIGGVAVLDSAGNSLGIIGLGQLTRPIGVAWDSKTGLLYVGDSGNHQVKAFDMSGSLVRVIGNRGEEPGEFNYPTHLAIGHGKLVVADTMNSRIQVFDLEGNDPPFVFGQRGNNVGDLVRPKGVATDSEGNIYVVESLNDYVLIFDKKGRFLLPIGGTGHGVGQFYLPAGVSVDARNRIYVADTFNGRVVIFQFLGGGAESE